MSVLDVGVREREIASSVGCGAVGLFSINYFRKKMRSEERRVSPEGVWHRG
jgi:hypothetical protein